MTKAREQLRAEQGEMRTYWVMLDQLEARIHDGRDGYLWDAQGWYGGDINKLWIKSEGEGSFGEKLEEAEVQALWSHAITPWFDVQAGIRYDFRPEPERGHLVLGLQGLSPYFLELDGAGFVSDEGDVSARLEAEYDLLITQRLILQPRAEINFAVQDVRELGIGSGVNDIELGLRLRYEFAREFAPYIGVQWERKLGETADFARDEDESVDNLFFVAGVRIWF
jgi:copper resistance protein B